MLDHRTCATALLAGALLSSPSATALAQGGPTATQTVDAMNQLWGRHPGTRANHAKGVVVLGSFTPTAEAATLSKASLFQGGAEHMDPADAAKQTPDFLIDELPQRLAREPVAFRMMAQLADAGDQTKDPSQPWPADRRLADLGTITITKAAPDDTAAEQALRLLPNRVPAGIEASDDPLISARVQSYLISFGRRN